MDETQTPDRKAKRVMTMHEACMFMATYTKTQWDEGMPCSITDMGDGNAMIVSIEAAFVDWKGRHQYSSPCVYWP